MPETIFMCYFGASLWRFLFFNGFGFYLSTKKNKIMPETIQQKIANKQKVEIYNEECLFIKLTITKYIIIHKSTIQFNCRSHSFITCNTP